MDKPNWNPVLGGSSFVTYKASDGVDIICEQVSFIPDVTIRCNPPFIKGVRDSCWVKYREGNRPGTKQDWQKILGMSLQTML